MEIKDLHAIFLTCSSLSTDTRKIEPGSLFVALKGEKFDANTFAEEAVARGAAYVLIDNPTHKTNEKMLVVKDSLKALQELASFHRNYLGLPIIALTGSNGKTTTKELIHSVLSKKYNTKATVGNLNNHIGVPLTLLSFTKETEIGIVEMGANHQKEIEFLCTIAQPNFGYITNFGKAHLEGFGGYEGVIKGKSELYNYLKENTKTAFVNLDDAIQAEKTENLPRYSFAVDNYNCDVRIEAVSANPMAGVIFDGLKIQSNLLGIYNATNISAAIAIGTYFKVSSNDVKNAIEGYYPNNNRSQLIEKNGNKIILDAYNANPSSMNAAITAFAAYESENKMALLGDMFELGTESRDEHASLVSQAKNYPEIEFHFVGNAFYTNITEADNIKFYKDYEAVKLFFQHSKPVNKAILIKGSRGMALERILEVM